MITLTDVTFAWPDRVILQGLEMHVAAGEAVAVMGPSGSGKSTLLNLMAGIATPGSGTVRIDETEVSRLSVSQRATFRLHRIGVVFQFGELLPELNVIENVALPLRLQGKQVAQAKSRARPLLERLGIADLAGKAATDLSGGEAQRVGIARALINRPQAVLADEPTGALDEENAAVITRLLLEVSHELGAALVIATHDPDVAAATDRILRLRNGVLAPAPHGAAGNMHHPAPGTIHTARSTTASGKLM